LARYLRNKIFHRIIDANINRTKEGLRVLEEITRFVLNSRGLTSKFKTLRHSINKALTKLPPSTALIKERESLKDIGKNIYVNELKRKNIGDIFSANIQRAKESLRVLEEFSKLINKDAAVAFKKIRYEIYGLEKEAVKKISRLYKK